MNKLPLELKRLYSRKQVGGKPYHQCDRCSWNMPATIPVQDIPALLAHLTTHDEAKVEQPGPSPLPPAPHKNGSGLHIYRVEMSASGVVVERERSTTVSLGQMLRVGDNLVVYVEGANPRHAKVKAEGIFGALAPKPQRKSRERMRNID